MSVFALSSLSAPWACLRRVFSSRRRTMGKQTYLYSRSRSLHHRTRTRRHLRPSWSSRDLPSNRSTCSPPSDARFPLSPPPVPLQRVLVSGEVRNTPRLTVLRVNLTLRVHYRQRVALLDLVMREKALAEALEVVLDFGVNGTCLGRGLVQRALLRAPLGWFRSGSVLELLLDLPILLLELARVFRVFERITIDCFPRRGGFGIFGHGGGLWKRWVVGVETE
ncbi:hypothetical protein C8F01DRAFT_146933 [Mycena amicta]|nr:hypothetical protein C8F01DRAFT_146933 [Mycena amicta]